MTITTRKPTGKPPWPMLLIAGAEKCGKSYACAAASASKHVGRTFWIGIGEDDPDELGALAGARFEIVEHDGTYRGILTAVEAAVAEPPDGQPNMIVIDSCSRLWSLLCDMAQADATARAKRKRRDNPEEADITMDLWNTAKGRWHKIIDTLKAHNGPVVLTARLELTTVMDNGQPTKDKDFKVQAEKSLVFDVGAVMQLRSRTKHYLTGVRSLNWKPAAQDVVEYPGFTVEKLWSDLGITAKGATADRQFTATTGEESAAVENGQPNPVLTAAKNKVRAAAHAVNPDKSEAELKLWIRNEVTERRLDPESVRDMENLALALSIPADPWAAREPA